MSAITAKARRKMKKYAVLTREPRCFLGSFDFSWEQRKAKEICSIGTGKSNTQDQVDDGKYPFYIRSDVPVRSNKYLYDCEAVITIGDGNIGKVFHYVNGKFDLHQRCYKMTDFKDIWGKYFFYYFSTKFYDRAMKMTAKATVDSVRLEMISEMDIKKPPQISEQKQIAEFFANLDNLITLHQRKCANLCSPSQVVFSLLFATSTFSWEQRKLGEVIRLNGRIGFRGYTEKDIVTKDDGGVLTFSPTNIVDNKLTTNCKNTYITRFKYDESPEIKIHNGDILFVKTGSTLGKSALVTGLSEDATLNPQVVVMRTNNLNVEFLAAMLVTNAIISQVNSAKIGGAIPTLTETRIKDFDVAIPVSEAEKEQIGQFFSQLDHLITLHQRKPFLMKWRTSDANRNQTNRLVL